MKIMTREERCELAIEKGYTYNTETGLIYNRFGNVYNRKHSRNYIMIAIYHENKQYIILGHQFAWYYVNKECVECLDHINGIAYDNRICNLRSITPQKNCFNQKNAKGYCWNKNAKKWQSQIGINKKSIFLGYFNTELEAKNAYLLAKQKYHII
jgi:hypothetical protein